MISHCLRTFARWYRADKELFFDLEGTLVIGYLAGVKYRESGAWCLVRWVNVELVIMELSQHLSDSAIPPHVPCMRVNMGRAVRQCIFEAE